jgi:hypothetical protein
MISSKQVEESKEYVSKYIKPGIAICKIAHIEAVTPEIGSPHLKLYMETHPLKELENEPQKGEFSLYTTENATKYTLAQITAIAKAAGISKEEFDKIEAPDWNSYIKAIYPLITNKFLRFKFRGEEVLSKNTGNKWLKASLPTWNFVEPVSETVGLTYSEEKDITKLPEPDAEDMVATSSLSDDDMPF